MEVNKNKIGILTTVYNWDLYNETVKFFPAGIDIFAVDGTKGLYGIKSIQFFLKKLKPYNIDWLIMADEDVIFTKPEKVFDLINYLANHKYTISGMRDGGVLKWRNKNPYVINTFFAILNLKDIYSIYDEKEMLGNQYIQKNEFAGIEGLPFENYEEESLFESYYCFFFWLLRKGKKIKFLDGSNPLEDDYATTLLLDHKGDEFLYHTWYARFYNKNPLHTKRIEKIIQLGKVNNPHAKPVILINHLYHMRIFWYKQYRKLLRGMGLINLDLREKK